MQATSFDIQSTYRVHTENIQTIYGVREQAVTWTTSQRNQRSATIGSGDVGRSTEGTGGSRQIDSRLQALIVTLSTVAH